MPTLHPAHDKSESKNTHQPQVGAPTFAQPPPAQEAQSVSSLFSDAQLTRRGRKGVQHSCQDVYPACIQQRVALRVHVLTMRCSARPQPSKGKDFSRSNAVIPPEVKPWIVKMLHSWQAVCTAYAAGSACVASCLHTTLQAVLKQLYCAQTTNTACAQAPIQPFFSTTARRGTP